MIKIKRKKLFIFLISCFFMAAVLFLCKNLNSIRETDIPAFLNTITNNTESNAPASNSQSDTSNSKTNEQISQSGSQPNTSSGGKMIGVWVPYLDLDINSLTNTEKKFQEKFQNIINVSKNHGMDTLIVHVRSHSDAMYPSKIFPWSHLLTGTQGVNPGFDPLSYMIKTSHENGLKFHAWINPLRIQTKTIPKKLSDNNPYFKLGSQKYFINHTDGICCNPAYAEVRKLVVDGVKEIVQNYDVDGIHFDDYFYPEEKNLTSADCAYEEYLKSSEKKLSLQDWRKKNINILVKEVYEAVKSTNSKTLFGISPAGNIKKCDEAGADVKLWASGGNYVDYLCPQIYWSTDYTVMPFEKTAGEWKNILKNSNVKIYSGLALYKAGTDLDNGTWKNRSDILASEFKILEKLNYNGLVLYSWSYLNNQ